MEGFSYAGAGNSTTKKEAQFNSCKDFINFLVRSGILNSKDVPQTAIAVPEVTVKEERVEPEKAGQGGDVGQPVLGFRNQGQMPSVFQVFIPTASV